MDIFFSDASEAPVPPEEVRIRSLSAEPYPDGQRVKVGFTVTPFQQRPNIEIKIENEKGTTVAELSVVEVLDASMDFTMHIREPERGGEYRTHMRVFYSEIDAYDEDNPGNESASEILDKTGETVDTAEVRFHVS